MRCESGEALGEKFHYPLWPERSPEQIGSAHHLLIDTWVLKAEGSIYLNTLIRRQINLNKRFAPFKKDEENETDYRKFV